MPDGSQSTDLIHAATDTALMPAGGGFMAAPRTFQDLKEMAKYMAKGELMVGHSVRGNPGDCMAVIMQAGRFGMDPFALSQKTYVVTDKGGNRKIAYEAQAVTSMIFASRAIEGRLRYKYEGDGPTRRVTVVGRVKGDSEDCDITTPMVQDIKVKNSPLWASDPDQQLAYYGSRAWARRHTPDVLMGVYDVEEFDTSNHYINVTPGKSDDPATRLQAAMDKSSQERAQAQQVTEPEEEPDIPDAEIVEPETKTHDLPPKSQENATENASLSKAQEKPADTDPLTEAEQQQLDDVRQQVSDAYDEANAPQGDLLGEDQPTDGNGAKLKKAPPTGKTMASQAVEDAQDAATSPEVKEPPANLIRTAAGAEAWAESFSRWYRSLTKAQRQDDAIGGKVDALVTEARKISDTADTIINDAVNTPAADEEI